MYGPEENKFRVPGNSGVGGRRKHDPSFLPSVPSLSLFCIFVDGAFLGTILASASLSSSDDLSRSKQARLSFKGSLVRSPVPPSGRSIGSSFGVMGKRGRRAELSLKARKFPLLLPLSPLLAPTDERGKGAKRPTNFPQGRTERAGGRARAACLHPSLPPCLPFGRTPLQGWTLRCAPGSVNIRRKNCGLMPAAGRSTQLFHLIFMEPRAHHKVHPCTRMEVCPGGQSPPERTPSGMVD